MNIKLDLGLRIFSATAIAYGMAVVFSFALVPIFLLGFSSVISDAVYFSIMLSYVVCFAVAIASFSVTSVKRLYLSLFIAASIGLTIHAAFVSLCSPSHFIICS